MAEAPKHFVDDNFVQEHAKAYVPKMEALAASKPGRFEFNLKSHILAGYALYLSAVLFAVLLGLLSVVAALAARTIWLIGAALGSIASALGLLQSLKVEFPPPKGIVLERQDAPQLFSLVENLRQETGAPQIETIFLTRDPNASIGSRYLNGLFGRTSTTLHIGLPLLQLLTPEEIRTLLHHEFAHSAGGHGRLRIWAGRVWQSWSQLPLIEAEMGLFARMLLPPIYRWFMPKLGAYWAVLSRRYEFIADREADLRSKGAARRLLVRIELCTHFMQVRFWPEIWKGTRTMARTPREVFSRLPEIAKGVTEKEIATWTESGLRSETGPLDSHPALTTRLQAVGGDADPQKWVPIFAGEDFLPQTSGASEFLGAALPKYEEEATQAWARSCFLIWEEQANRMEHTRAKLAKLEEKEKQTPLNAQESVELAGCHWELDSAEKAVPLFRSAFERFPNDPNTAFNLGRCLLAEDKEEGLTLVERTIAVAPTQVRYQGTIEICSYLERHNRHAEAVAFYERMARENDQLEKMLQERGNISPYDTVISHGLDGTITSGIAAKVVTVDWAVAAYLCRKPTPLSPDRPLYMLCLKPRKKFLIPAFRPGMTAFDQVAALNCFPAETRFLLLDGAYPTLEKKIRKLPDSLLFKR